METLFFPILYSWTIWNMYSPVCTWPALTRIHTARTWSWWKRLNGDALILLVNNNRLLRLGDTQTRGKWRVFAQLCGGTSLRTSSFSSAVRISLATYSMGRRCSQRAVSSVSAGPHKHSLLTGTAPGAQAHYVVSWPRSWEFHGITKQPNCCLHENSVFILLP